MVFITLSEYKLIYLHRQMYRIFLEYIRLEIGNSR